MPADVVAAAASSNARWCRAMCASHGIDTEFSDHMWFSQRRTPRYYPDAVTLDARATAEHLLREVDDSRGCSVKDSYYQLDLSRAGFIELLSAQWIQRPAGLSVPEIGADEEWRPVANAEELTGWERHWADDDESQPDRLFTSELLNDPHVTIVGGYRGDEMIGGGVIYHDDEAAHVSNVFTTISDSAASWAGLLAATDVVAEVPVFSWERVQYIDPPMRHGFKPLGPLRVWWRTA